MLSSLSLILIFFFSGRGYELWSIGWSKHIIIQLLSWMDELRGSQQSSFSGHIAKESEKQTDVSLEDYIDMEFLMESEDGNDR